MHTCKPTIATLPPHQQPCKAQEKENAPKNRHPLLGALLHLWICQLMCESVYCKDKYRYLGAFLVKRTLGRKVTLSEFFR